ncbi:MAG: branched-chain amino acid ABC transporter permease [Deltaproteobacteria bacterium]|nr:MAG: branched-chain amino acid ABC transporter permease [Deltaproteobacteria bacterium]HDG98788.1 branched-chain amino acid ABC transporter permease [Desulfobacterales bacterium]
MFQKYSSFLLALIVFAVLFAIGMVSPSMWQPIALIMFYIAMGQAFNIFMGMTGYVNFGYVAFLAIGSYGMALGVSRFYQTGIGLWLLFVGFALAIVMAAILSLLVGGIALRLRGAYFAIATIGVNEGLKYLIEGGKFWGGSEGIIISKPMRATFGRHLANSLSTFWADVFLFIIALLAAYLTFRFMHSRVGYALTAVREDEDAAKVMGVNATKYKLIAFIVSSCVAGLIGATTWCLKSTYVFPEDVFEISYTVEAIVIVMLGGSGTLLGPIIGGLIYGICKYWLAVLLPGLQLLILAPLIILIIVAFPGGIVGVIRERIRGTVLDQVIV